MHKCRSHGCIGALQGARSMGTLQGCRAHSAWACGRVHCRVHCRVHGCMAGCMGAGCTGQVIWVHCRVHGHMAGCMAGCMGAGCTGQVIWCIAGCITGCAGRMDALQGALRCAGGRVHGCRSVGAWGGVRGFRVRRCRCLGAWQGAWVQCEWGRAHGCLCARTRVRGCKVHGCSRVPGGTRWGAWLHGRVCGCRVPVCTGQGA